MATSSPFQALCAALCIVACSAPVRSTRPHEAVPVGTADRMAEHFEAGVQIKDSVLAGDLRGVRTPGGRLIERTTYPSRLASPGPRNVAAANPPDFDRASKEPK